MTPADYLAIADRLCDRAGDDNELLLAGAAAIRLLVAAGAEMRQTLAEHEAAWQQSGRQQLDEIERLRAEVAALRAALQLAKAALEDIGDADREPGDDVAWCERRAAQPLPIVRTALAAKYTRKDGA